MSGRHIRDGLRYSAALPETRAKAASPILFAVHRNGEIEAA
jgi:hypothetical protein